VEPIPEAKSRSIATPAIRRVSAIFPEADADEAKLACVLSLAPAI
jgi:hypothetical protein